MFPPYFVQNVRRSEYVMKSRSICFTYIASRKKQRGERNKETTGILHEKNKQRKGYCKPRQNP